MSTLPEAPLIEFRNVTVVRGDKIALDRLSLTIPRGENLAIIGPNGCGKSTLVKTITQECRPSTAYEDWSLKILGQDNWRLFDLRALLGIVSNDLMAACTRDFTGREIVLSGFFGSVGIWPHHEVTREMEEKAEQILDLLEVGHLASRWMDELSSGEARRILIGRALVNGPGALVLDEPANSLDLAASQSLSRILRKLAQAGTSIVMVTHHLPDIIPEITRVVFMRKGKVYREGGKEELLTTGTLSEVFETPLELARRDGHYNAW
jgi:iron complex transport system ATP-binding protein